MTVDADLYGPIANISVPVVAPPQGSDGIVRHKFSLMVDVQRTRDRYPYVRVATDMMDHIVKEHQSRPNLLDVRSLTRNPNTALDLAGLVQRFHDGESEIWISRPKHMSPEQHGFEGRFGYIRANRMTLATSPMGYVDWSWVVTDHGHLPAIDLGLIMVPTTGERWYRVFKDKVEAESYYRS